MQHLTENDIQEVVAILKSGGVIVYPTETSYGLGADATSEAAVKKIFVIKDRPEGKGTPIILPSIESASDYVELSPALTILAKSHWPGPLNVIAPALSSLPASTQTDGTQAVRVSSHPFAAALARDLGRPIVATSANPSGSEALYSLKGIEAAFDDRLSLIDAVVDVGDLSVVPASTTVKEVDGRVVVVRQGNIQIS